MIDVTNKYALIVEWDSISYDGTLAHLHGAKFTGPVLTQAAQINGNDLINLDFTLENVDVGLFLPMNFFIATLSWRGVEYKENNVLLTECKLSHNKAGTLKELQSFDKILIDCSNHEEYKHQNYLVYPSWVLKPTNEVI